MALNSTGPISIGGTIVGESINLELKLSATAESSIGQTNFRTLAKVPTGTISLDDFHGKSDVIVLPSIDATTNNAVIIANDIPGYIAGDTKIELTVEYNVYVYSTTSDDGGLTFDGFTTGDEIKIINNGYIQGKGGSGGNSTYNAINNGQPGGNAIDIINSIGASFVIENYGTLLGGGGGGGGSGLSGGGGGAGGGNGGFAQDAYDITPGGAGGGAGMPGQDGAVPNHYGGGGSGGGGGGAWGYGGAAVYVYQEGHFELSKWAGKGGLSGGSGGANMFVACGNSGYGYTGAGGSYNNPGGNGYMIVHLASNLMCCAGGGGGWGASGGSGGGTTQPSVYHPGGPGGKAVSLNGASITVFNSGVVAGAIS